MLVSVKHYAPCVKSDFVKLHFYKRYIKENIRFEGQVALRLRMDKNT